jgi:hypothetical protein
VFERIERRKRRQAAKRNPVIMIKQESAASRPFLHPDIEPSCHPE